MKDGHGQQNGTTWTNPASVCNITTVRFELEDPVVGGCSKVALCIATMILHVVSGFRVIEFLPWRACSTDLSPIQNVGFMLSQRLARHTPPAAASDKIGKYAEADAKPL
ncbi:hypothetical protein TNCV_461431 [Trichonephila clavipes]|nr:hypothetical protein TNCV_461431 [Trichonephila clavipes]